MSIFKHFRNKIRCRIQLVEELSKLNMAKKCTGGPEPLTEGPTATTETRVSPGQQQTWSLKFSGVGIDGVTTVTHFILELKYSPIGDV